MRKNRKDYSLLILLVSFGLIYCSISLVNHYNFRTFGYDLGLVNNAIYDYAHFRWNDCMLMQPQFSNILEDHFTLLQVIFSPLYYVFGSYTMLVVQIISILFGGYGIYKYFAESNGRNFALIATVHFLTAWGIFSALAFDYHDNVVGTMAVPWLFYFFKKEKWLAASIMAVLVLISKENMALWMGFISLGLLIDSCRSPVKMKVAAVYSIFSFLYFFVIIQVVMPSLAVHPRGYLHFQYAVLGKTFTDALLFFINHPIQSLQLLFINHLPNPAFDNVKTELHIMVLVSGGYCLLLRPQYLLMLVPVYAQKLFSDDVIKWGINYHYSIEFAPILTIALFTVLASLQKEKIKMWTAVAACALSVFFTIHKIDRRVSPWYSGVRQRFYSPQHYRSENINVPEANRALETLIPANAIVSAQHAIVPHVAFRDKIYLFPVVQDAAYIILLNKEGSYPLTENELLAKEDSLRNNGAWKIIYDSNNLLIFQRKDSSAFSNLKTNSTTR